MSSQSHSLGSARTGTQPGLCVCRAPAVRAPGPVVPRQALRGAGGSSLAELGPAQSQVLQPRFCSKTITLQRKEDTRFKEENPSWCLCLLPWDQAQLYTDGVVFCFFCSLIKKTFKLCAAIDRDYSMFVLQRCYGSAYGFIWWKFAEKSKEVLCTNDKQT